MSRIQIRKKPLLYSKKPGILVPWKNSNEVFQIFPCKLILQDAKGQMTEWGFDFKKPVQHFSVHYSLLGDYLEVHLEFDEHQIVHYRLKKDNEGWVLSVKRASFAFHLHFLSLDEVHTYDLKEHLECVLKKDDQGQHLIFYEQVFFGVHKKADVDQILDRSDLKEMLAYFFLLGQRDQTLKKREKTSLLKPLEKAVKQKKHDEIARGLQRLFKLHFSDFFLPHLDDHAHWQNYQKEEKALEPFLLYDELYLFIRSLLFEQKKSEYYFLPHLIKELSEGRACFFQTHEGILHLEWSKKSLKKIHFKPKKDCSLTFVFPSKFKKGRIRVDNISTIFKNGETYKFKAHKNYYLDRFEK